MAVTEEIKLQVKADLKLRKYSTKELMSIYGISATEVSKLRKEIKKATTDAKIDTILEQSPETLEIITRDLPPTVKKDADTLVKSVDNLSRLQEAFQDTGYKLARRISDLSDAEDLSPAQLKTLAQAFNETVQAFNTSNTTVFMNQNNDNSQTLSLFKQSLRA